MKISELNALISGEILVPGESDVTCGLTCDLLSWVMAKGTSGCAWATVQTHMNVVAVASLHDMACIILPENVTMEQPVLDKAAAEGIAVIKTALSAYQVCGIMYANGVPGSLA